MQVTKGTWCMHEQCVPGSLSSSPAQEPGNEAIHDPDYQVHTMVSSYTHTILFPTKIQSEKHTSGVL